MFESIGAFLSKLATSFSGRLIEWIIERFRRPTIHLKRAPENLFDHIAPGTSLARAREALGTPRRVDGQWHSFAFRDAHVQIGSDDSQSAQWVGVVLPKLDRRVQFPIAIGGMGPLVLGKSTLADVLALDPDAKFKWDSSSKHWCFWIESYFGFSGMYRHYLFGVIDAPCVYAPKFEWDHANNRLASDPKTVRFNWMAVSASPEVAESFNYWAFI